MHQRPSDESVFSVTFLSIFKGEGNASKSLLTIRKI